MFQPQIDRISADAFVPFCAKSQTALGVKLNAREDIDKVLCLTADPTVTSYEINNEEVSVNGRCSLKLLVNDASGLNGLSYNADFVDKIACAVDKSAKLFFTAKPVDVKYSVHGNVIDIDVLVEITVKAVSPCECDVLTGGEGILTKTCSINTNKLLKCDNFNYTVEQDLNVDEGIGKILFAESSLDVEDYSLTDEVLKVSGNVNVGVVFLTEENKLVGKNYSVPFSTDLDAEGYGGADAVTLNGSVVATKIRIEMAEDGVNQTFTAQITLAFEVCGFKRGQQECVCDAYSVSNNLDLTSVVVKSSMPSGRYVCLGDTEQVAPLDTEIGNVERFVTLCGVRLSLVSTSMAEGACAVEGLLSATAVYETQDNKIDSTALLVPVSYSFKEDWMQQGMAYDCVAEVKELTYRKDNDGLVVKLRVKVVFTPFEQSAYTVVSTATEGAPFQDTFGSIEVCIARKGEDLWSIAKSLRMKGEDIMAVNPDLVTPLTEDERIVVYHRLAK